MPARLSVSLTFAAAICLAACDPASDRATETGTTTAPCIDPVGPCILDTLLDTPAAFGNSQFLSALVVSGDIDRLTRWVAEQEKLRPAFGLNVFQHTFGLTADRALAAVALAMAAFNSVDPYSDERWLAVAAQHRDDWAVSRAAALLLNKIGFESWEADVLHRPPGYAAIVIKLTRNAPDDDTILKDILFDLTRFPSLKPLQRELLDRISALAGSNPDRLASVADYETRFFANASAAEAAMKAGGAATNDYNMPGLLAQIATARLKQSGYDKSSAQLVVANLIEDGPFLREDVLDLLATQKAFDELRRIGDGWRKAARAHPVAHVQTAGLLAGASACYRLAGDTDAALAVAREGIKIIPQALDAGPEIADMAVRRREAGEDNGMRTAPALALYQAGAEDEALASNFLAGRELLQHWAKPLDQFDPQWLVDDGPKWLEVIISDVISTGDRAFAARVYNAYLASPATEPRELAILAATAGKAAEAATHLKAMRQAAEAAPEKNGDRIYYLLATITAWRAAEMLLANLP